MTLYNDMLRDNICYMCFTETWLNPVTMDIYKIDGFQDFHMYRPTKKGGSVSLYQYTLKLI